MNLSEAAPRTPQHLLVYGDTGSGKSTLASLLAKKWKLIWISVDGGHVVLYKLPPTAQANVNLIILPDTRDYPIGWTTVNKIFDFKKVHLCNKHGADNCSACNKVADATWTDIDFGNIPADTIVVIDHGTQVGDSCMNTICKNQPVDYKPKLDDWGSYLFQMSRLGKQIQVAPFNVIFLAQVEENKIESGDAKLTPKLGSSSFSKSAGQFFDHVVFLEVKNKAHKGGSATTYGMSALTKSRTDVVIEKDAELSLEKFFDSSQIAAAAVADKDQAAKTLAPISGAATQAMRQDTSETVRLGGSSGTAEAKAVHTAGPETKVSAASPGAGQATKMTAASVPAPAASTVAPTPGNAAKAALERLKGLRK